MRYFITYHNIRLKNYLNLCYKQVATCTSLAKANNKIKQNLIKKENHFSDFSIIISKGKFFPLALKIQRILSPFSSPKIFIASLGIIVLSVEALGFGESTFVFISMIFIPLIFINYSLLNFCKTFYKYFPIYFLIFGNYFPNIYILWRSILLLEVNF